jgi:hypothetical protein
MAHQAVEENHGDIVNEPAVDTVIKVEESNPVIRINKEIAGMGILVN